MIDLGLLADEGYVTAPVLGSAQIERLHALFQTIDPSAVGPFFASSNDLDRTTAEAIDRQIKAIVAPALAEALPGLDPFLASFLVKRARGGANVEFHQDLTYTDETTDRAVVVWIPLEDVDETSGALNVVPGSNRWAPGVRPGGLDSLPTSPLQAELAGKGRPLTVSAGTGVFYDAATIHGSPPNNTDRDRVAVGVALAPVDARLIHAHRGDDDNIEAFVVDEAYYTVQGLQNRPEGYPTTKVWGEQVTTQALAARCADPRVLRDPMADADLAEDGFVVVPLPAAIELADRLRDSYGSLHGWVGTGFEADLTNADAAYCHAVSDLLAEALDDVTTAVFEEYEPFLRVFLCKWPGPASDLYLHRDWMYVDERHGHRSFVVWIPLQDVDMENGPLQVLAGSHRFDDRPRGTHLNAPWIGHADIIRPHLDDVPVSLGQAVIMNNALVHASRTNTSAEPRLVAAIGLRPRGVPLVHFRGDGEDHAVRYDIDEDFLLDTTPQALLAAPPDLPRKEELGAAQLDLDGATLEGLIEGRSLEELLSEVRQAAFAEQPTFSGPTTPIHRPDGQIASIAVAVAGRGRSLVRKAYTQIAATRRSRP